MKTKTKKFDCVEMQHHRGQAVMKRLAGMTLEEEVAYWKRGTEELCKLQKKLRHELSQKNTNKDIISEN